MPGFIPTHKLTMEDGHGHVFVMLEDGAAYTWSDWDLTLTADYERNESGIWTFQGKPFTGTVHHMTDAERTQWLYWHAKCRVDRDDDLAPHAATILDDHGDGDEHFLWVIDADPEDLLQWVKAHN